MNYTASKMAAQKSALKKFLMLLILSPPASFTGIILNSGSSGSTSRKLSTGYCAIIYDACTAGFGFGGGGGGSGTKTFFSGGGCTTTGGGGGGGGAAYLTTGCMNTFGLGIF